MRILTLTTLFPNAMQPDHAVFVRARMEHYIRRYRHQWAVVAPVPYFPRLPFKTTTRYDSLARVPALEDNRGYPVHHPRYLLTPKVGMKHYGGWISAGVRQLIRRLHAETPFDLIDGHYIYPDGTAAIRLGAELGVPVVLSARGTDLNLYPDLPGIGPLIRANLAAADHLICVCAGLRHAASRLGAAEADLTVIGNGVDTGRFHRGDQATSRQALGLPRQGTIILAVGHLTERKGFHLLIEALAGLQNQRPLPSLVLVGDGVEGPALRRLAQTLGVGDRVLFPGAIRNEALPGWYQAADLFALASSREGWPNVLCEAQACGLPVVATDVWGIPEIIRNDSLGVLVADRTTSALQTGLETALNRPWDRDQIARTGQARTWDQVADELNTVFEKTVANHAQTNQSTRRSRLPSESVSSRETIPRHSGSASNGHAKPGVG